jgi:transposase
VATTTKTKHAGGRRPLLGPEVEREYFTARGMGLSLRRAAGWAGVAENTIKNWLARGEAAGKMAAGKRSVHDQNCLAFLRRHEKVDQEWMVRCETVLNLAMGVGTGAASWHAASFEEKRLAVETAKFKLTHQAAGEYSTRTTTELTGADGGAVDVELSGGLDVWHILKDAKAFEEAGG